MADMMDNKKLSGEESWRLIQDMIQVAKEDHRETGLSWLIWGWLLFTASVLSVVFSYAGWGSYIGWTWMGVLLVGTFVFVFTRLQRRKDQVVKTYVQELLQKSAIGFFISMIILVGTTFKNASFNFGYFYVLYAFWLFIHGSAIRFRPQLIGAIINWAAAIAIFLIKDFKYDMMVSAVAILGGYLVPGYMLRARYRRTIASER
jgi:Flp pilus assembly protein TadB